MRKLAKMFHPNLTLAGMESISSYKNLAQRHDIAMIRAKDYAYDHLAYANELGTQVYLYLNSHSAVGTTQAVSDFESDVEYLDVLANHPDWFIYDSTGGGKAIVLKAAAGETYRYVLDMTKAAVRAYRVARIQEKLEWGFAGIFLDVTCSMIIDSEFTASHLYHYEGGDEITEPELAQGFADFVSDLKDAGISVWFNDYATYNGDRYLDYKTYVDAILANADYVLLEGLTRYSDTAADSYKTETHADNDCWVDDVNALMQLGDKCVAQTKFNISTCTYAQLEQYYWYALASYLLGSTDNSHFAWYVYNAGGLAKDFYKTSRDVLLTMGDASETLANAAAYKNRLTGGTNTYHRAFENGVILVNPTASNDASVTLPGGATMYDITGTSYAGTATMNANTGLVLFTSNPTL